MPNKSTRRPTIAEWFRGRKILVTGGTGFMGKVLLAKLLMCCPDIETIYVLIREKKNLSSHSRLLQLVEEEPFRLLRENNPERLKKLVAMNGDTTCPGLAISPQETEILKNNVSAVVNMAANVRFDLTLRAAVNMNAKAVANVIALLKQFKKLDSFVHVSTAYCHCGEPVLEEKFYPIKTTPESMMQIVDETDDVILEALTPKILGDQPNTYAFTKALSEELMRRCGLPAGVIRPSIVVGSFKEPDKGWVDNMNGPTGLMIGAGKGVIRTMLCNADYHVDLIPCDIAVNATIALVWKVGVEKTEVPAVVNVTESHDNPITWKYALETGRKHALANPFSGPLWYPGGRFTSSKLLHWISVFLFHTIPAYFLDAIILLTGNKPFLVKVQSRVTYGINLVYYYTTKQWVFKNDKLKALRESLTPEDQKTFFMDIKELQWDDYLRSYILGARKYCLKDDPSTLPKARRVFAYLYVIDLIVKLSFCLFCCWLLYSWFLVPYKITVSAALETMAIQ